VAFSRDGNLLAFETNNGSILLVDPETGRKYARLENPNQDRAMCLAFTPDGRRLVSNNDHMYINVWELPVIRAELAAMGLDWELPPFPPPVAVDSVNRWQMEVDWGPGGPRRFASGQ
jgi:WD40 repeat protein